MKRQILPSFSYRYPILALVLSLVLLLIPMASEKKVNPIPVQITSLPTPSMVTEAVVKRVIDGDTIDLTDGTRVRYIGINAPELSSENGKTCYAHEATAKNKALVAGKTIRMAKDISETDTYGRILRYVWVGDVFVNETLIEEGFAHASTFPPDVLYKDAFLLAEKQARKEMIGLWGATCVNTR